MYQYKTADQHQDLLNLHEDLQGDVDELEVRIRYLKRTNAPEQDYQGWIESISEINGKLSFLLSGG